MMRALLGFIAGVATTLTVFALRRREPVEPDGDPDITSGLTYSGRPNYQDSVAEAYARDGAIYGGESL
jgi:hypothetical protein